MVGSSTNIHQYSTCKLPRPWQKWCEGPTLVPVAFQELHLSGWPTHYGWGDCGLFDRCPSSVEPWWYVLKILVVLVHLTGFCVDSPVILGIWKYSICSYLREDHGRSCTFLFTPDWPVVLGQVCASTQPWPGSKECTTAPSPLLGRRSSTDNWNDAPPSIT